MRPEQAQAYAVDELEECLPAARELDDHDLAEIRGVIGAVLFEYPVNLDIRHLWTSGLTSYFRVNWWAPDGVRGPRVRRSAFLCVTHDVDGYRVSERTQRAVA